MDENKIDLIMFELKMQLVNKTNLKPAFAIWQKLQKALGQYRSDVSSKVGKNILNQKLGTFTAQSYQNYASLNQKFLGEENAHLKKKVIKLQEEINQQAKQIIFLKTNKIESKTNVIPLSSELQTTYKNKIDKLKLQLQYKDKLLKEFHIGGTSQTKSQMSEQIKSKKLPQFNFYNKDFGYKS